MQLLGRYHRLPLDSESVRHGKTVLGFQGTHKQIMKRIGPNLEEALITRVLRAEIAGHWNRWPDGRVELVF